MPPREVLIANRHPRLRLDRRAVARVIHILDAHFQIRPCKKKSPLGNRHSPLAHCLSPLAPGELSLAFLTDAALTQLHADFLADPTPTDVITFEGNPAEGTAGEICVSVDAARSQIRPSAARPSTFDFSTELTLYLVHGWLHLAGYDDLQPLKKRRMRRAEAQAMKLLQAEHALPRFSLKR